MATVRFAVLIKTDKKGDLQKANFDTYKLQICLRYSMGISWCSLNTYARKAKQNKVVHSKASEERKHKYHTTNSAVYKDTRSSSSSSSNFKSTVCLNHRIIVYQHHHTNQPQWQNSERRDSTYAHLYQSPTSCTAHYIYISCSSATIKMERHKILKAVGVMQKSGGTLNHL